MYIVAAFLFLAPIILVVAGWSRALRHADASASELANNVPNDFLARLRRRRSSGPGNHGCVAPRRWEPTRHGNAARILANPRPRVLVHAASEYCFGNYWERERPSLSFRSGGRCCACRFCRNCVEHQLTAAHGGLGSVGEKSNITNYSPLGVNECNCLISTAFVREQLCRDRGLSHKIPFH